MATSTDVCNAALVKIGEKRITSQGFASPENERERVCSEHYDRIRDGELRKNRWNFAIERVSIAEDATAPVYGYDKRYALPADFLKLIEVDETEDFQLEGGFILCDVSDEINIRYIKRVTVVNSFDPLFYDALAARLGVEFCARITGKASKKPGMQQEYREALAAAAIADAIENPRSEFTEDSWITARL